MNVYISYLWNKFRVNFWVLPALMAIGAFAFSFLTIYWDEELIEGSPFGYSWVGSPEGARALLSTIAGSIITITGVVFSLTIVSLALASNQFGSRVLGNFMSDTGTQIVLGTFIATSIYAFLILRTVRSGEVTFVPNISVSFSILFLLFSLATLIYFIHHLSVRVQSSDIISRVGEEFFEVIDEQLESYSPFEKEEDQFVKKEHETVIRAAETGYLQTLDYQKLFKKSRQNHLQIDLDYRPGNFISEGEALAKVYSEKPLTRKIKQSIENAFMIGKNRSPTQDIEYSIDQLVGIALQSLGTNSNDTFTANSCLDYLGAALCKLCKKELNPPYYDENPYIRLSSRKLTFEGLLDAAFNQIRQYSAKIPSILIHLAETLHSILQCTESEEQRVALTKHMILVENAGKKLQEQQDQLDISERITKFNNQLKKLIEK